VLLAVGNHGSRLRSPERQPALQLNRRGCIHVDRWNLLGWEVLSQVVENQSELLVGCLRAQSYHFAKRNLPAVAVLPLREGAGQLVPVLADSCGLPASRAVRKLPPQSAGQQYAKKGSCHRNV